MVKPTDCIIKDFNTRWYKFWSKKIGYLVARHPKFWESAMIAQFLKQKRCLKNGKKGVVFGAGSEQLVSVFASYGVNILATDQSPDSDNAKKWDNGQLTKNKKYLFYPNIIDRETFNNNVDYENYDMNTYNPKYKNQFDFVWHNCVVGHIGSMEKSLAHLERSAKYIKKGGYLAFTTELNISSSDNTISENSDTIIWRLSDIELMFKRLAKVGLRADRFKLRLGDHEDDLRINYENESWITRDKRILNNPNYSEIKIAFANYAITQIFLSFKKTNPKKAERAIKKYVKDRLKNEKVLIRHIKNNPDLLDYYTEYNTKELLEAKIIPKESEIKIKIKPNEIKPVNIEFKNKSKFNLFGFGPHWPINHSPLVLATADPVNRKSIFYDKESWFSNNRPSVRFSNLTKKKPTNFNTEKASYGDSFKYSFNIHAPNKPGQYTEKLCLIFEGLGELNANTNIDLRIVVEEPVKNKTIISKKITVTPQEFFKIIDWDKIIKKPQIKNDFIVWLDYLAKDSFSVRYSIDVDELEIFLINYIKDNGLMFNNYKESVHSLLSRYYLTFDIKINDRDENFRGGSDIYFVLANPRSGNTAITEALCKSTSLNNMSGRLSGLNLGRATQPMFIKSHTRYSDFMANYTFNNKYKTLTIKRNPLDTLLSAFRFSQKTASCSAWLDGEVFPEAFMFKGLNPLSPEFINWATGKGGRALLSVTDSWLGKTDSVIKYEDFIDNGNEVIEKSLIDLGFNISKKKSSEATKDVQDNFLVGYYNEHRWTANKNNWQKYLTKDIADEIYKSHKSIFKKMGYDYIYENEYSNSQIIKNNKNW